MTLQPLAWSDPSPAGYASIKADDGVDLWRITPVPRDVTRISYQGRDPDGTLVCGGDYCAYAESQEEAKIIVDLLRSGTDHLRSWREQLEAAGFVRSYPSARPGETLAQLWQDKRASGIFHVNVNPGNEAAPNACVHATYESGRSNFWHNVSWVCDDLFPPRLVGDINIRSGLPHGIDTLKIGVAAALAIREARLMRGGRFATPIGGATKPH